MAKFPIFVSLIVSQIIFYPEVIKVRITFWVCHFLKPADITNDNKKITIFTVTICFYLSSRLLTTEQLLSQETRNMKKKYPNEKKKMLCLKLQSTQINRSLGFQISISKTHLNQHLESQALELINWNSFYQTFTYISISSVLAKIKASTHI